MLTRLFAGAVALGMGLIFSVASGYAQTRDIGKTEFASSCAACHGVKGKGNGPLAALLTKPPADLTKIQKNNAGIFPFNRIYEIIDGRTAVAAHGPRDMPIWGDVYSRLAGKPFFGFATPKDIESLTRGRIIALVGYIYSLQEK